VRKVLVFQHVPYELLGTLNPLLKDQGFRIRYVNFGRHPDVKPEVDRYDALIILGGPMTVDQVVHYPHLNVEVHAIKKAIEKGIPVLGICLGAQLIAKALGANVKKCEAKEIGWYDVAPTREGQKDSVLGEFSKSEKIFQWHGDTFEIPKGAQHLAMSKSCGNQAFKYGKNVYGFQFHLEVNKDLINRWLNLPLHQEELQALRGQIDPKVIIKETEEQIENLKDLSRRTFTQFLNLLGHKKKNKFLGSR